MAFPRTVVIAGAGIGGLTAALAIARQGFRVSVFEAADRLEEVGAGIQLSPNASRILIALGLGERLAPHVVVPEELKVMNAATGRVLARAPLGAEAEKRYGAPFWLIHRGDLQAALRAAVEASPEISLHLGTKVEDFAVRDTGVTDRGDAQRAADRGTRHRADRRRRALVEPAPSARTHRRAAIRASHRVARARCCGRRHAAVHRAGGQSVARPRRPSGALPGQGRAPRQHRRHPARRVGRAGLERAGRAGGHPGALSREQVAGIGARPHRRGATVAEMGALRLRAARPLGPRAGDAARRRRASDAALSRPGRRDGDRGCGRARPLPRDARPTIPAGALRLYERQRHARTARTQRAARRNGTVYHLGGVGALLRTLALRGMGKRLIRSYDWLYGWQPA